MGTGREREREREKPLFFFFPLIDCGIRLENPYDVAG